MKLFKHHKNVVIKLSTLIILLFQVTISHQLYAQGDNCQSCEFIVDDGTLLGTTDISSGNNHTRPYKTWLSNGNTYIAVKSTHQLQYMTLYHGTSNAINGTRVCECSTGVILKVNQETFLPGDGLTGNTSDARWTIYNFGSNRLLENGTPFFIKGQGGGHDVGGSLEVLGIERSSIIVTKEWIGSGDHPSVELELSRTIVNNSYIFPSETVTTPTSTGNNTWTHTFENMPINDVYGRTYIYTLDEPEVPNGYTKNVVGYTVINRKRRGLLITNPHIYHKMKNN
ncbi:Cna B-type domain-containing protein [Aequorivita sp. KMM 9714]|uniref:Cna B-type domain-containing protein n=1 Tax=Aequorivita sp. KMM 9714 TaxID=2707173 RepID=UPI0013EC88B9|nr:Cna B-type domain-containing protein [Aequorivita sp. KMM 9714]NGX85317.1 Cna B-type domain-containing protein [Aequorivita sp. KMM 9714]